MTDFRGTGSQPVRRRSVYRSVAAAGALVILVGTAACTAGADPTPPSTASPAVVTSAITTTVPVPARTTDYLDPVDVATSFMTYYAAGALAGACRFVSDDYGRTEAQAGRCSGINHVERLPVVNVVDNCELATESYRVRFTVVPGTAERPLPIAGTGEQHLAVDVSFSERGTYGVDGPPTAYDPASSCPGSSS